MNRSILAFMYRFAALVLLLAAWPVQAKIDAPDHVYYGSVTLYRNAAPAGTVIEARTPPSSQHPDGVVVRRYVIGSNSHLGNYYSLPIPMDQVDPPLAGRARPGDPLQIFVNGMLAAEVSVGIDPQSGENRGVGSTTRLDLDPQNTGSGPAITIEDASLYEGHTGKTPVSLLVEMNQVESKAVKILWETRDDTAFGGAVCGAGVDYIRQTEQMLTIAAGNKTGVITVEVCGNTVPEMDKEFTVELLSTVDDFGVFEKSTGRVTIMDDDNVPTLTVGNVRVARPQAGVAKARFRASLSRNHDRPISFSWNTQNGSAIAGQDYLAAGGEVTIAAGDTMVDLEVDILPSTGVTPDRDFRLHLSGAVSVTMTQTYAYGTIVDTRHDPALEEVEAVTGPELVQLRSLAIAPDGGYAYAIAGNTVVRYDRDAATGRLTAPLVYGKTTPGFESAAMQQLQDIRISEDGGFVYLAAANADAITVLARDVADGTLDFVQSIAQNDMVAGGTTQVAGLKAVQRVALSPDGEHLYAIGRDSHAIARFDRDTVAGTLAFVDVLTNSAPGLGALSRPNGLAVSADGRDVYVSSRIDNAVIALARNTNTGDADFGKLSHKAVYRNKTSNITGLGGAFGLALPASGQQLYVAAEDDNGVVLFDRHANGELGWKAALQHCQTPGQACQSGLHGLRGTQEIVVAPDGKEVFASGREDSSLTVFKRDPSSGALTVHRTLFKGDNGLQHLDAPGVMVASDDNRHLYVMAHDAIVIYTRLSANVLFSDGFESTAP